MRNDLLALSLESLVILANVGLVKRAQKEVDAGTGPSIEEDADGTVVASSRDGATTRIPRDTPLKSASCTCGSSSVCRHRVAAVLAYQRAHASAPRETAENAAWGPGEISDDALLSLCGEAPLARARDALKASFLVTTRPGAVPVASLPSSTVQFLAPRDLAFAKCDCSRGHACEHVALAVWAFRKNPGGGPVDLGVSDATSSDPTLTRVTGTLRVVATRGLTGAGVPEELRVARASADQAGLVWVADALEDLERQREGYDRQSALFSSRTCSLLLGEIAARIRAARNSVALPPRWILGSDEARETQLEQVRLVALGARLDADGERRIAEVFFAEPDSKSILVLRKEWSFPAGTTPKNGHELAQMFASSKLSVGALARGELITRAARRRANGLVDLSAARGMKSSMLPTRNAWDDLPEPIRVSDLASHERAWKARPPAILAPRKIGERIHAVTIARVVDVTYYAGEQELCGIVEDHAGTRLILRTRHRTVSPGAIDAVRQALAESPRFVSGELRRTLNGWEMTPLALVGERLIVPDLEKPRSAEQPGVPSRHVEDEFATVVHDLEELVDRGVHKGWASVVALAGPLSERLSNAGMGRTGDLVRGLASSGADRLLDLAVLRALAEEAFVGS
jgi:hypothetical protein